MWVVLVNNCVLVRILVLRIVIPETCMYIVSRYAKKLEHDLLLSVFLCVKVGGTRWLTPTNFPPRGMRCTTLLQGIIDFGNKYAISL